MRYPAPMDEMAYSYLDSCAARLNALLPRFANIARFEVSEDAQEGNYYIHAIPADRVMVSAKRNQLSTLAYNQIGSAFPKDADQKNEPTIIAKKHPGTPLALEFYSKSDLIMTITALERMPKRARTSNTEAQR